MCRILEVWLNAPHRLQPQVVNKAREWLTGKGEEALGDWDISRDAPYFGIPIPDAPGKYFYVWLDAPVGYLASLKNYFDSGKARARGEARTFEEFLAAPATEQIHFIGKDIIYFHTLFWPAMLKFAGAPYKTPNHVYVHGFITVSGEKMSKSRGTGISPLRYLELGMNAEWLRYYIAAKLNGDVEDIDFNPDDFVARVNSDLIGKYVNIASRCAGFISKRFGGKSRLLTAPRGIFFPGCKAPSNAGSPSPGSMRIASTARHCARSPACSTRSINTSTSTSPGSSPSSPQTMRRCMRSVRPPSPCSGMPRSC